MKIIIQTTIMTELKMEMIQITGSRAMILIITGQAETLAVQTDFTVRSTDRGGITSPGGRKRAVTV